MSNIEGKITASEARKISESFVYHYLVEKGCKKTAKRMLKERKECANNPKHSWTSALCPRLSGEPTYLLLFLMLRSQSLVASAHLSILSCDAARFWYITASSACLR